MTNKVVTLLVAKSVLTVTMLDNLLVLAKANNNIKVTLSHNLCIIDFENTDDVANKVSEITFDISPYILSWDDIVEEMFTASIPYERKTKRKDKEPNVSIIEAGFNTPQSVTDKEDSGYTANAVDAKAHDSHCHCELCEDKRDNTHNSNDPMCECNACQLLASYSTPKKSPIWECTCGKCDDIIYCK